MASAMRGPAATIFDLETTKGEITYREGPVREPLRCQVLVPPTPITNARFCRAETKKGSRSVASVVAPVVVGRCAARRVWGALSATLGGRHDRHVSRRPRRCRRRGRR